MADGSSPLHPGDRSRRPSCSDTRSALSEKSVSPNPSRSNSKSRDASHMAPPERSASFDSRAEEKKDDSSLRSPNRFLSDGRVCDCEIETVEVPMRRSLEGLAALSVVDDQPRNPNEPIWPKDWRAYGALLGGFLLMFNSWGIVNSYGTFSSFYVECLLPGHDLLLMNLVGATQSFVVLALSAPVGRLLDAGYIPYLTSAGTVLVFIGSLSVGFVNGDGRCGSGNYGLIWLVQGFITGLGMACFFVSSSQVVATWFIAKKGLAIGIVASGASISGLVIPMMLKFIIDDHGFNPAARWVSALSGLTSILAFFLARPNPKHPLRRPETWAKKDTWVDTDAFYVPSFAWLCASISFLFFGFYAVFFNLEEWAVQRGFGWRSGRLSVNRDHGDAIESFWLLAIMNASSTIGRIGSAYLCDRFGALHVHCTVTYVASMLVLFLWQFADSLQAAIAFVVCFGAFSGAVIGLPPASCAQICDRLDLKSQLGHWTGMMYGCSAVFALSGPLIAGHLISVYDTYATVQNWSGGCLVASASCMAMAIWYLPAKSTKQQPKRSSASSFSEVWDPPVKEEV